MNLFEKLDMTICHRQFLTLVQSRYLLVKRYFNYEHIAPYNDAGHQKTFKKQQLKVFSWEFLPQIECILQPIFRWAKLMSRKGSTKLKFMETRWQLN
ncbi:hypothetical protein T10_12403 [Trichinella papuae]|uniref:Uncharacterized protein n=1 Tax=Trichinella papuae TaxID=268474 RepID=A0A0V1MPK6_9BILA|nr:hypothetical protein T10_12403 [Trichinella papuae]